MKRTRIHRTWLLSHATQTMCPPNQHRIECVCKHVGMVFAFSTKCVHINFLELIIHRTRLGILMKSTMLRPIFEFFNIRAIRCDLWYPNCVLHDSIWHPRSVGVCYVLHISLQCKWRCVRTLASHMQEQRPNKWKVSNLVKPKCEQITPAKRKITYSHSRAYAFACMPYWHFACSTVQ